MAEPGWYADPTAPDGRRYWDGSAWAANGPHRRPAAAWGWLVVALAVVGAIVVGLMFVPQMPNPFVESPVDTRTNRPSETPWNELSPSETPTPTPVETGFGEPIPCPDSGTQPYSKVNGGRLASGHLSIAKPKGSHWQEWPNYIDWMYDYNTMLRYIADGWISNVGVGYIKISDGFSENPATAAEQFITCMATSDMFRGYTKREILINEDYTVSGRIGWRLHSKVYVEGREYQDVAGDEVNIVLIPTDDPDVYATYISCATINHEENLSEVQAVFETLTYE